jgi:hypothetical protein
MASRDSRLVFLWKKPSMAHNIYSNHPKLVYFFYLTRKGVKLADEIQKWATHPCGRIGVDGPAFGLFMFAGAGKRSAVAAGRTSLAI